VVDYLLIQIDRGKYNDDLTSTPIISADWGKPSDQRWTVPFGGGIGKMTSFIVTNPEEYGYLRAVPELQCILP